MLRNGSSRNISAYFTMEFKNVHFTMVVRNYFFAMEVGNVIFTMEVRNSHFIAKFRNVAFFRNVGRLLEVEEVLIKYMVCSYGDMSCSIQTVHKGDDKND